VGAMGVEWDGDAELYYMRARWYDPETSRFMSVDPVRQINLYIYTSDNPLRSVDPDGQQADPATYIGDPSAIEWPYNQPDARGYTRGSFRFAQGFGPYGFEEIGNKWDCSCPDNMKDAGKYERCEPSTPRIHLSAWEIKRSPTRFTPLPKDSTQHYFTVICHCEYHCKCKGSNTWRDPITEGIPRSHQPPKPNYKFRPTRPSFSIQFKSWKITYAPWGCSEP